MWSPDSTMLGQLVAMMGGTLDANPEVRQSATDALEVAKSDPRLDMYLCHLLALLPTVDLLVRAAAGTVLKNRVAGLRYATGAGDEVVAYLKENLLQGLVDGDRRVRLITGNVATQLFLALGPAKWPQVLVQLVELAKGAGNLVELQEGAVLALAKICEDHTPTLNRSVGGERPLDYLVPQLIGLTLLLLAVVRAELVHCLAEFVELRSPLFLVHMDLFLARLFALATDQYAPLRQWICTAFLNVIETRPDKLVPHIDGIVQYCLHTVDDRDKRVALEACEFLLNFVTLELPDQLIRERLGLILPKLLDKMVYSGDELLEIEAADAADDAGVSDRDEDVRPMYAKGSDARGGLKKDESEDEDEDDGGIDGGEWTVRKCSAATLDVLALTFGAEVVSLTLPQLKDRLVLPQWPVAEAAILTFGAIAEGLLLSEQLPELVPFLVERLQDPAPRVRQMACWTLLRYARWVCDAAAAGGPFAGYFMPTIEAVVRCALDAKKVVQQAACLALGAFVEQALFELISPLVEPLLRHFGECFLRYQRRNMVVLYDTVQLFVEKLGGVLASPQYVDMLLPPLLAKWGVLANDDNELWPLLECMLLVAALLGDGFAPYAVPVYQRALAILAQCRALELQHKDNPLVEPLLKDFVVALLDLLDGVVQGLGVHSAQLFQLHLAPAALMEAVVCLLEDSENDVRQLAYALLGDLAIYVFDPIVAPSVAVVVQQMVEEITARLLGLSAVCNNAAWAFGEMLLRMLQEAMAPYAETMAATLVLLIQSGFDVEETVLENAAIALGRMGTHLPGVLAPHLPLFFLFWSQYMDGLVENDEKATAFIGMCHIVAANPLVATQVDQRALGMFLQTATTYQEPPPELQQLFHTLVHGFHTMLGDGWREFLTKFVGPEVAPVLEARYGV